MREETPERSSPRDRLPLHRACLRLDVVCGLLVDGGHSTNQEHFFFLIFFFFFLLTRRNRQSEEHGVGRGASGAAQLSAAGGAGGATVAASEGRASIGFIAALWWRVAVSGAKERRTTVGQREEGAVSALQRAVGAGRVEHGACAIGARQARRAVVQCVWLSAAVCAEERQSQSAEKAPGT